MSEFWFPGMKQRPYYTIEEAERNERWRQSSLRTDDDGYDPYWEKKLLMDFIEKHPNMHLDEVAVEFGKPYIWCWDRLGLFSLNELASYCFAEGVIKPLNAMRLAKLTAVEQGRLLKRAVKMTPTDFRIAVDEFVREKVMAVEIPIIPPGEFMTDALKIVPILKHRIDDLRCKLQAADEFSNNLNAAYRRAVSPDPDRFYKD